MKINKHFMIFLFTVSAFTALHALDIYKKEIREIVLPAGELVRLHVSGYNGDCAAVLKRTDDYWVYLNQVLYGPYSQVDILQSSPFNSATPIWQFRAVQDGRNILVVNGTTYGPFDFIWTPNFSADGRHWGVLLKKAGRYALIVDRKQTDYFDYFFSFFVTDPPTEDVHSFSDIPFFYGKCDNWVAIGYRNPDPVQDKSAEFRILTGNGEGRLYDRIDLLNPDDPAFNYADYNNFLTVDGESFVISVHQADLVNDENYLWHNSTLYGPYAGYMDQGSFLAGRDMAIDGSNWVIAGKDVIFTRNRTFSYEKASSPGISGNGRDISFIFFRNDQQYSYVDGKILGPFQYAYTAQFSSDGKQWILPWFGEDNLIHLMTQNGDIYGPYTKNSFFYYLKENWVGAVLEAEGEDGYVLYNGQKIAGPFHDMQFAIQNPKSSKGYWYVAGYKDNSATLTINDQIRFKQNGIDRWNRITISDNGNFWAMSSRDINGNSYFIDNGLIQGPLPEHITEQIISSGSKDKNALLLIAGAGKQRYIAIDGQILGPYTTDVKTIFSYRGGMWAISAAEESGTKVLLLPGVPAELYTDIIEMQSPGRGNVVIYNGFRDNRYFPGINNMLIGSYAKASISCRPTGAGSIYLAADDNDRLVKIYKIAVR